MLPASKIWTSIGLLILGAKFSRADAIHTTRHPQDDNPSCTNATTSTLPTAIASSETAIPECDTPIRRRWIDTTQRAPVPHSTTCPRSRTTTSNVPVTIVTYSTPVPHCTTCLYSTTTCTVVETVIVSVTSTVVQTIFVSTTSTIMQTTTIPTTSTIVQTTTVPTTSTILQTTTIPTTSIIVQTITVSRTIYTTQTSTSVYDPCPTTCSVSAGTVELVFWPTNNDYAYPSTYVNSALDYTFTPPSVYMIINTIYGYNSAGRTGPSATNTIFALDLDEVSTIVPGSGATRQLSLSDLSTDCPLTAASSVLATMIAGGPCDPILAAPSAVKSWASPCGACGDFGLFDPPYAIPTATNSLLATTVAPVVQPTTTSVAATPASPSSIASVASTTVTTPISETSEQVLSSTVVGSSTIPSATSIISSSSTTSTPASTVQVASAARGTSGTSCLILSFFVSLALL